MWLLVPCLLRHCKVYNSTIQHNFLLSFPLYFSSSMSDPPRSSECLKSKWSNIFHALFQSCLANLFREQMTMLFLSPGPWLFCPEYLSLCFRFARLSFIPQAAVQMPLCWKSFFHFHKWNDNHHSFLWITTFIIIPSLIIHLLSIFFLVDYNILEGRINDQFNFIFPSSSGT